jgi:hypothetical protein
VLSCFTGRLSRASDWAYQNVIDPAIDFVGTCDWKKMAGGAAMVAGGAVAMGLGGYVVVAVPHVPRRPGRVCSVLVAEGLALRVEAVDVEVAEVAIERLSVRQISGSCGVAAR